MSSDSYAYEQLAHQRLSDGTPGAVCEILPVTLESNQVVLLRRPTDSQVQSWLVPHQPDKHPNEAVLQHLAAFFGEVFEPHTSIVHSTSWRYECQPGRVILTYLVVLPQRPWIRHWMETGRILFEYVGAIQKVQGDNLHPPEKMKMDDVLAHALDHLALLSRDDRSIQTVLTPEWIDVLGPRLPKPAGFVGFVLSHPLAFQDAHANAEKVQFVADQIIFRQSDPADKLYLITRGQVDVLRWNKRNGREIHVARLKEGQYFGEIGVRGHTERTATVRAVTPVECLALNRKVVASLLAASREAYNDMDRVLRRRIMELGVLEDTVIENSLDADLNTVIETRMIRDQLKVLEGMI